MESNFYQKLVDLYAGGDLPENLTEEMEHAAFSDRELSHDMSTLKKTVDLMRQSPAPEFTEESHQRILMKLYARGVPIETQTKDPTHMQLYLPISG